MGKTFNCTVVEVDWIGNCEVCSGDVALEACIDGDKDHIILTPNDARKLRKQIKKALEAIEGVEEESEEELPKPKEDLNFPDWFHPGAIVEITRNESDHDFPVGEKVKIIEGTRCEYLDGHDYWFVRPTECKPV